MTKSSMTANVIHTSLETFDQDVLEVSKLKPVLVDFWADWCSPCIVLAPILDAVAIEYAEQLVIAKLEVDEGENMKLAGHYRVRGFPTVILFRDGEEVARFSGAKPKQQIEIFIDSNT
jgi:thioredoxin 1